VTWLLPVDRLQPGGDMKYVQNVLLVVGAMALGACAFLLALYCFTEATGFLSHHGPSDLAAAGLAFLFIAGSSLLGALVGLIASVWWIWKHESRRWTIRIWVGAVLGLAMGVVLHFANRLPTVPSLIEAFEPAPAAAALSAALAMLGGLIANFTDWRRQRSAGNKVQSPIQPL